MLLTRTDTEFLPAVDGGGRAAITDPDEVAACRAVLEGHPLVREAMDAGQWPVLSGLVRFTRYLAGYAVMSAGERADRLGIVLAGRCRIWRPETPAHTVAWIEPGALLGEMSTLAGAPRTMTVGALRDTVLAEFDTSALESLDDLRLAIMLHRWIARVIAQRALGQEDARPAGMNLVVAGEAPHAFAERLVATGRALGERWALRSRHDWPATPSVQEMEAVERQHDYVVYVADGTDGTWRRRVMRQADRIMVVADATGRPDATSIDGDAQAARAPTALILLQPAGIEIASGTARWLRTRRPDMHLHVRDGNAGDVARCLRLVTGRGRGVAFAGASSRGLGYCGLIQALEELGLAPDIVTGNSSGAIGAACMAAGVAAQRVIDEIAPQAYGALKPRWNALTLPIVSLMTGRRFTRFLQNTFGDVRMEDLLTPCVLTAVDLGTLTSVDLRSGPLWQAVRASSSLPAYYPPVVADHRVLVDGGVLQNLPVGPLEGLCRNGFVLLGDLSQDPEGFTDIARYGSALSGWRLLLERLWPFGRRQSYPTMPEVLFRTACLASLRNQEELLRQPRPSWIHLRPDTPPISLFGADDQIPRLIEDTRRYTLEVLGRSERPALRAALSESRGVSAPDPSAASPAALPTARIARSSAPPVHPYAQSAENP